MGKQELPKYQSCILKVNIHCEGCENKVRKLVQKTDGVYSVKIDADSGKVLVAGNIDPVKLIKKLKRAGKHAELWGGQRGNNNMYNNSQNYPPMNQFKNMQIDPAKMGKHNDPHKLIGKNQQKVVGGNNYPPQFQNKGSKNIKDQKSVRFNLPEEEDFDASDDEDFDEDEDDFEDDYEDEDEDEEVVGQTHPLMQNKANMMMRGGGMNMMGNNGQHARPNMSFHNNGGVNGKKGNVIDLAVQMKGKGGNKNGNAGGKNNKKNEEWGGGVKKEKAGKRKASNDKKNGKSNNGGFFGRLLGLGKKSKKADTPKFKKNGAPNNNVKSLHNKDSKKKSQNFKKLDNDNDVDDDGFCGDFQDFDIPTKSKPSKGGVMVKGNGHGNVMPAKMGQMGPMDHMRNIPVQAVQGLPAAAMNGGYYQGMQQMQQMQQMQHARPIPYNTQQQQQQLQQQQQYMAMMMSQQQQQQANMNQMYQPMMYGRPQGPMGYMPPPPMPSHPMADPMTHVFSDENTESCAIM